MFRVNGHNSTLLYYIFEVIEEDGEEQLQEVEDDELLDKLADIFEERLADLYEIEEMEGEADESVPDESF